MVTETKLPRANASGIFGLPSRSSRTSSPDLPKFLSPNGFSFHLFLTSFAPFTLTSASVGTFYAAQAKPSPGTRPLAISGPKLDKPMAVEVDFVAVQNTVSKKHKLSASSTFSNRRDLKRRTGPTARYDTLR